MPGGSGHQSSEERGRTGHPATAALTVGTAGEIGIVMDTEHNASPMELTTPHMTQAQTGCPDVNTDVHVPDQYV